MTDALKVMVEAMIEEMRSQRRFTGGPNWVDVEFGPTEMTIDGQFDLEKVARAGLLAIREPDDHTAYIGSWEVGPGGHPAKKRELSRAFTAMIDAITKEGA